MGITAHMHKRTVKFTTDLYNDGVRLARRRRHGRQGRRLEAPLRQHRLHRSGEPDLLAADHRREGDELPYTCTNDNGVTRPVRLGCEETPGFRRESPSPSWAAATTARPVCKTDADCAGFGTGRCVPANLVFGYLADDDMCILPGLYYDCPGDAASCID